MIARKRYAVVGCWAMAALLTAACELPEAARDMRGGIGNPVSNLPSWETAEESGGDDEDNGGWEGGAGLGVALWVD